MKNYGDITKINGADIEITDVVIGGSPCQDLSVAGKRAGLEGARSGLFMEQIRLIKEMRNEFKRQLQMRGSDEPIRPRYMVWENVCGAFSSNSGEDFRAVLEETVKVADPDATIPRPAEKWKPCGCIVGDGYSLAWRTHDAQYFGCPQRRKRICILADFNGDSAGRLLFETQLWRETADGKGEPLVRDFGTERQREILPIAKGVSGNIEQSGEKGQGTPGDTPQGVEASGINGQVAGTLDANYYKGCGERGNIEREVVTYGVTSKGNGDAFISEEKHTTLSSGGGEPGQGYPCILGADMYNQTITGDKTMSVTGAATDTHHIPSMVYGIASYESNSMKSANPHSGIYQADTSQTVTTNGQNPSCNQGGIAVAEPIYSIDQGTGKSQCNFQEGVSPTLATTHQGEPAVCGPIAFEPGVASRCGGHIYEDGVSGTVRANAGDNQQAIVYENHSQDTRYREMKDVCQTVSATYGLGGNNQPLVVGDPKVFDASRRHNYEEFKDVSETVQAQYGTGGNNTPIVIENDENISVQRRFSNVNVYKDVTPTLEAGAGEGGNNMPMVLNQMTFKKKGHAKSKDDGQGWEESKVNDTLNTLDNSEARTPTLVLSDVAATLNAQDGRGGVHSQKMKQPEGNFVLEKQ